MNKKINLSRMTIDMPQEDHRKLKATAAVLGLSMRELVLESVQEYLKNKNASESKDIDA